MGKVLLEQEAVMRGKVWAKVMLATGAVAGALLMRMEPACAQGREQAPSQQMDLATVGALLQKLQAQVQDLHAQVSDLKAQQQTAKAESAELRKELEVTKSQLVAMTVPTSKAPLGEVVSTASNK